MSSRSTLTAPPSNQLTADQRWTLALASVGSFLVILDLFAVTTALPTLRVALHASITTLDWTINAYTLTFAVLLMTAAALGDRWGRRRVYASGLLLFAVASVACALAPNGAVLIGARAVQGIGAAVTMPTALALINAVFPTERRGWAQGVFGAVTGLATVLGPVFGGVITQMLSWSYIFWINFPIGVAAAVAVLLRIRDVRDDGPGGRRAPDLLGLVLGGASVLALVWGVVRAATDGWGDRAVVGSLVLGGVALVLAVFSRPGLWYPILAVAMAVVAVGFTFAVPALTKSVVGSVKPADIGTASGLFSTVRQVGAAFGVAVASAAFTATGGYPTASAVASGYRGAMIVAAVLAGLGTATTTMSRRAASRASTVLRG